MATGDNYRMKALELLACAESERDPNGRAEYESLAAAYLRLAEQAEKNSALAIEFHLPPQPDKKP